MNESVWSSTGGECIVVEFPLPRGLDWEPLKQELTANTWKIGDVVRVGNFFGTLQYKGEPMGTGVSETAMFIYLKVTMEKTSPQSIDG